MKVKDLIAQLESLDPEGEVKISTDETTLAEFTDTRKDAIEMRIDGTLCMKVLPSIELAVKR